MRWRPFFGYVLAGFALVGALRSRRRGLRGHRTPPVVPGPPVISPRKILFLASVRGVIEANLSNPDFTVEALARASSHSRSHLHRRLKELTGESPSELIRRLRLERGARLLEEGSFSISRVAHLVGFKSVSHFSNRFHDHFGVRPSRYRRSTDPNR
ncbi:MAG: AraC family transcriptional regulator [Gemmatimonadales bacterium]|nr:MAG: AraC family transcriptional regulator [Gemmatimonadales bacterium]